MAFFFPNFSQFHPRDINLNLPKKASANEMRSFEANRNGTEIDMFACENNVYVGIKIKT